MTDTNSHLLRVIEMTREHWDQATEREAVRSNFQRLCACRTPALGGEVYASTTEEKVFYHTCKSRCCPSCGNRGTQLWQREQWVALPDIPFVGLVLTMPDVFWPIFGANRRLQHDLPAVGAAAVQQWAWNRYRVRLHVIVVPHTFGGHLNHHPHLHLMVSAGGFMKNGTEWVRSIRFDRAEIMDQWRFAVTSYLWKANRQGSLGLGETSDSLNDLILRQTQRRWNIHITRQMTKRHFLAYAGRYIRRLPISQKRILRVTDSEVAYQSKDTRSGSMIEARCTPIAFVGLLSQHVPDRYRHAMRYFGLLAPRTKAKTSAAIFLHLRQHQRPRPLRLSWRQSLIRDFQTDPLQDRHGQTMHWVCGLAAKPA